MKTKLLLAAALLLSGATFAQATAKTEQAATVNATVAGSSANENLNSSANTSVKTHTATKAEMKAGPTKQEARVGTGNQGNKVSQKASINDQAAVSASSTKTREAMGSGTKTVSGTARSSENAAANASLKAKAGIQHAVKPRPASLKLQTQMKAGAGLKIK
ncbi:MAG TPA: hypothetical protein VK543_17285 [Puia sp.]|nr:hypothetical protein [Puia sp.]